MLVTKPTVLDQYYEYFKNRLGDCSQESINYLVTKFLGAEIKAAVYDEEAASQICLALMKINKVNRDCINAMKKVEKESDPITKASDEYQCEHNNNLKIKLLVAEIFPLLKTNLKLISPDKKNEIPDLVIFKFIEVARLLDESYQKLDFDARIKKNFIDDAANNKKFQVERYKKQLKNLVENIKIQEKGLDSIKKSLEAEEKSTPSLNSLKIQRIKRHLNFIKEFNNRINEIDNMLQSLEKNNNLMPDEIIRTLLTINSKLADLIKSCNRLKSSMEKEDKLIEQEIDKDNFSQEETIIKWLKENLTPYLEDISKALGDLEKFVPYSELKRLAENKNENAKIILTLFEKIKLNATLNDILLSSFELRNTLIDQCKTIVTLPQYLTPLEVLEAKVQTSIDIFSTYIVKNFNAISTRIDELKENFSSQTILSKETTEKLTLISKIEEMITKLNIFKNKIIFIKNNIAQLLGFYFKIPYQIQEIMEKDIRKLCDSSLLKDTSNLSDKKEHTPLKENKDNIAEHNAHFEKETNQHVVRLNALFMFEKIRELITKGYNQPVIKDLRDVMETIRDNNEKPNEQKTILPLASVFGSVPPDVLAGLIDYLNLKEGVIFENNIVAWQDFQDREVVDQKEQNETMFNKEWNKAIKNLKEFKGKMADPDIFLKLVLQHMPQPEVLLHFEKIKLLMIEGFNQKPVEDLMKAINESKPLPDLFKSVPNNVKERLIAYLKENPISADNAQALLALNAYKQEQPTKKSEKAFTKDWNDAIKALKDIKDTLAPPYPLLQYQLLNSVLMDPTFVQLTKDFQFAWNQLQALMTPTLTPVTEVKQTVLTSSDNASIPLGIASLTNASGTPIVTPNIRSQPGLNVAQVTKSQDLKDVSATNAQTGKPPLAETKSKPKPTLEDEEDTFDVSVQVQPQKSKIEDNTLVTPTGTKIHRRSTPQVPGGTPTTSASSTPKTPNLVVPGKPDTPSGSPTVTFHKRQSSYQSNFFKPKEMTPTLSSQQPSSTGNTPSSNVPNQAASQNDNGLSDHKKITRNE